MKQKNTNLCIENKVTNNVRPIFVLNDLLRIKRQTNSREEPQTYSCPKSKNTKRQPPPSQDSQICSLLKVGDIEHTCTAFPKSGT